MRWRFLLHCVVLLLCSSPAIAYGGDCAKISIHYFDRPPYLTVTPEGAKGLTAGPAERAFKEAGIPFEWKELPTARQFKLIEANTGCDCIVNAFKTPERESFGKYSLPIYQDQPHIALARSDNSKLTSGETVDSLLSNPDIILEVKKNWSYGTFLDPKIAQHHPRMDETLGDNVLALKKISARRADFFFTTAEEADVLIQGSGLDPKEFKYITFSDMPVGEKRYLFCSRQVDDEIIRKFNEALLSFRK